MKAQKSITALFYLAFIYDAVLGLGFLLFQNKVFAWAAIPPPNHPGYIQFPALLLVAFALLYLAVARNPAANRNLIPYGMMLKAAYCGVVFWHWFGAGLPDLWKPWALADLVFFVLFWWSYRKLGRELN